jgi:hypothetical protein
LLASGAAGGEQIAPRPTEDELLELIQLAAAKPD